MYLLNVLVIKSFFQHKRTILCFFFFIILPWQTCKYFLKIAQITKIVSADIRDTFIGLNSRVCFAYV